MVPSCGFSLAVSGRTIPLLVTSSRALGLMTTRSPRGLSLLLLTVALANAQFLLRTAGLCLPSLLLDVVCSTPAGRRVRSRPSAGTSPARARESLAHCLGRTRRGCSAIAAAAPDRPISTLPLRVLTDYRRRYGMSSTPGVVAWHIVKVPAAASHPSPRSIASWVGVSDEMRLASRSRDSSFARWWLRSVMVVSRSRAARRHLG